MTQMKNAMWLTNTLIGAACLAGCSGDISGEVTEPPSPSGLAHPNGMEVGATPSTAGLEPTNGMPTTDPVNGMPITDPVTGVPVTDPVSGMPVTDPLNGMPVTDPVTGMPVVTEGVDPGRVNMRRLTPLEYENTVVHLLGIEPTGLLQQLPADGRTGGFDNNSTLLGVATNQLEVFQAAAVKLARQAVAQNSPARERFFVCTQLEDASCQGEILSLFASQAWRRPATPGEVDELLLLSAEAAALGATAEEQLALAFEAVLTSPLFLFRIELDPDPTSLEPHPVGQYELASRLSYFLWSSMPDQQLFDLASQQLLHDEQQLRAEVTRMLTDSKAEALTTNFARQWLGMYMLLDHAVDEEQFPEYDADLRDSMLRQTEALFSRVLTSGAPVKELLTADDGVTDQDLQVVYGSTATPGGDASPRAGVGLLGHGSVLTLTSYPTRTSIVRRGLWVLENLLCEHPPAPPADLDTELDGPLEGTLRQRMAAHRADPSCAVCHDLIDPIGLGLENFDALGRFRETENGETIDPSGELLGQGAFLGPQELAELLASDPRVPSCTTEKLMMFALGRQTGDTDVPYLNKIQLETGPSPTLVDLVMGVVTSDPFLMRRGEN